MHLNAVIRTVLTFTLATTSWSCATTPESTEVTNLRAIAADVVELAQNRLPLPGATCAQPTNDNITDVCARIIGSNDEAVLRALRPQDIEKIASTFDMQALREIKKSLNADSTLALMMLNFDHFLDIEHHAAPGFGYFASKMTTLVTLPNGKVMPAYDGVYRALNGSGSLWGSALSYCVPDHYAVGKRLETALTTLPDKVKVGLLAVVAPKGLEGEHRVAVRNRILAVLKYRLDIDRNAVSKVA